MGRMYTVPATFTLTNTGGNADLCFLSPADDKPIKLVGFTLGQTSEAGDAAEENIRITVRHMTATVTNGSGGSAATPVGGGGGGAGFTARVNDTTVATTTGTDQIREELAWNERNTPYERYYTEEKRRDCFTAKQGEALVLRCESTVADDVSITLTVDVEEEG